MMVQLEKQIAEPKHPFVDPDFEAWMREVDAALLHEAHITSNELPDKPYHMYYIDGMSAIEMAVEALLQEGFYDYADSPEGGLI